MGQNLRAISFEVKNVVVPTANHQRKKIVTVNGFSKLADKPELVKAKDFWTQHMLPHRPSCPLEGPLAVIVTIIWPYRKSEPKKNRTGLIPHTSTPDLSNMMKTIEDRLKECGFIRDDAEIAYSRSSKWWGEIGSFEICISEVESQRRKEAK